MKEQTDQPTSDDEYKGEAAAGPSTDKARRGRYIAPVVVAAVAIAAVVTVAWLRFWRQPGGKPVPAPRSVSFEQSPEPPTTAEQRLVLTPDQARAAQIKFETVGEQPAAEASGQL